MALLAALLTVLAVLALGCRGGGRMARVLPRTARRAAPSGTGAARTSPALACAVAGAAVAVVVGLPAGGVLGLLLAVGGPRLLARLEQADVRAEREQLAADLPMVLDLLSSCLAGGASLPDAAAAVAAAVPGPAGRRLAAVSAQLAVGTPPAQAWSTLTQLGEGAGGAPAAGGLGAGRGRARDGGAGAGPGSGRSWRGGGPGAAEPGSRLGADPLAPAARALGRAAEGGAPVADAVARLAADARAQARAQGELAARRVGVLVVAPLGLCFLPAFVLLGVAPVVVGLVGPLLDTL